MHLQEELIINNQKFMCDSKCIPTIKFFNTMGLETEFSCESQGEAHIFRIIFSENVTDSMIKDFIITYGSNTNNSIMLGSFTKWARVAGGKFVENWMYEAESIYDANIDLETFNLNIA